MAKAKTAILINLQSGEERQFSLEHAGRIMALPSPGYEWKDPAQAALSTQAEEDCGCNDNTTSNADTGSGSQVKAGSAKKAAHKSAAKGGKA